MLEKILLKQLKPGETPILIIREYIITKFFIFASLTVVYFGLLFFMYPLISYHAFTAALFCLGLLAIIVYASRTFIIWYLDVMIVTAQRLIDIEQRGIFTKQVQEVPWPSITNVAYRKQGLLATLCNFGTIVITTSQSPVPIELQHVYNPQQLRDILSNHAKKTS